MGAVSQTPQRARRRHFTETTLDSVFGNCINITGLENYGTTAGKRYRFSLRFSLAPRVEESYRETPFDEDDEIVLRAWPEWNTESK